MVYNVFDRKTGLGISANEQLAEKLHKPVITKFKRRKVFVIVKDNIWGSVLAEMKSLSSKNKNVKHLLCVIDFFR